MRFGARIREARVAKKMTLRGLAATVGVSAPFMSDVERDRSGISREKLEKVCAVLGIEMPAPRSKEESMSPLERAERLVAIVKLLEGMTPEDARCCLEAAESMLPAKAKPPSSKPMWEGMQTGPIGGMTAR